MASSSTAADAEPAIVTTAATASQTPRTYSLNNNWNLRNTVGSGVASDDPAAGFQDIFSQRGNGFRRALRSSHLSASHPPPGPTQRLPSRPRFNLNMCIAAPIPDWQPVHIPDAS